MRYLKEMMLFLKHLNDGLNLAHPDYDIYI